MGGAMAAITGQGESFFQNPAALATLNEHEILTFHEPLLLDSNYDSAGYTNPVGLHNSFGAAFARLGTGNILKTTTNVQALSTFSSEQLQGILGYGFRAIDKLDFGGAVKYFHEQLDTYQGSGVGADVGLLYHFTDRTQDFGTLGYRNITLGFSVSNILQPQTKLFQLSDQPARVYRPALSYFYQSSPDNALWLDVEGEIKQEGGNQVQAGLEYGFKKTLFGRVGYDGTNPTAGVGLKLYGLELDYAYNQTGLGSLNSFSLTYSFGRYQDPLDAQKISLLKWVAHSYGQDNDYDPAIKAWQNVLREFPDDPEAPPAIQDLQHKRQNEVNDQLQLARAAMSRADFERAIPLIAKVLSLDPGNRDARELLRAVENKTQVSTNYTRGVEAYSREDYALAVQYLQMVYDVDSHYRDVNFLYHDAQSHYLPLESMSKDSTDLYARGVNFYTNGNYRKAIEAWEQVEEKNPKNFLVRRNIEEAKSRLKDKAVSDSSPADHPQTKGKP